MTSPSNITILDAVANPTHMPGMEGIELGSDQQASNPHALDTAAPVEEKELSFEEIMNLHGARF
jgi:hypothetical protein